MRLPHNSILLGIICLFSFTSIAYEETVIELHIKDHKFVPEKINALDNQKIKLKVYNDDDTIEEFESADLHREKIIPPKGVITVVLPPLTKGAYKFFGDFHIETAQGTLVIE